MSRSTWRRIFIVLAVLAFVGTVLALRTPAAWEQACTLARRNLPGLVNMDVGVGRCEIDPITQSVRLYGLSAFPEGSEEPFFVAESAEVRLRGMNPFFRTVKLDLIQLTRPRLRLDLSGAGRNPRAEPGSKPEATCPLSLLEHLWVDRLRVKGAEIQLKLPDGSRVELSGLDLGWKMRRGVAELELDARGGQVQLGGRRGELALTELSVEGGLDPEGGLELTRSELGLDDVTFSLNGKIEQLCDPTLFLEGQLFVPVRTAARVVGRGENVSGHLWAGITVSGKLPEASVTADVAAMDLALGRFRPGDFSGRLAWSGKELQLVDLKVPAGEGSVRASGSVALAPGFFTRLRVEAEEARLGKILEKAGLPGAWVDVFASGRGSLQGRLAPLSLTGDGDFRTSNFVVASRPYDAPHTEGTTLLEFQQGRITGGVHILPDHVELHDVSVSSGQSRFSAQGSLFYDVTRGLALRGNADLVDLSDFGHIAGLYAAGLGELRSFEVTGPYRDVTVSSSLSLRDFDFWDLSLGVLQGKMHYQRGLLRFPGATGQKGRTQYFVEAGELSLGKEVSTRLAVTIAQGRAEDLVDAIVRLHPSIDLFQGTLRGEASGSIFFRSPVKRLEGAVQLLLGDLTYYGRSLGGGRVDLVWHRGEGMEVDRFSLAGPVGALTVQGHKRSDGVLDLRFRGEQLSLVELLGAERAKQLGAEGSLTLLGKVEGDTTTPLVTGYLTSQRVSFAGRALGEMHLEGKIEGRQLHVFGRPFNAASANIHATLRDPVPYDLRLDLELPEIRPLLPSGAVSQGLSGTLSGQIHAAGQLKHLASSRVWGRLNRLQLSRAEFTGSNVGPIVLGYERGRATVESFAFRGLNTELTASGWMEPESLEVKVQGGTDMRLLEAFVPQIERSGGIVKVNLGVTGPLGRPVLLGSAQVRDVRLAVKGRGLAVRDLSGDLEFSDSRLLVQDVNGVLNDGRVRLLANLALEGLSLGQTDVKLQLDEVSYQPTEDLPLTVSGELALYGKPDAMVLSGSVDVVKLRYVRPLALETVVKDLGRVRASLSGGGDPSREWLRYDVSLHMGDVRVENNLAKARVLGSLKLTGSNLKPGLLGTLQAGEGGQAFFRGNRFSLSQGLVEFKSRSSIDPLFDVHAETQVREFLVRLHAFGRVTQPSVLLTSEPSLPEGDILSLLTLGVISRDKSNTASTSAGLAAEALFSATGLSEQVQRFLPKGTLLLRDLSFHISTTYNDATGVVEPAAQLESKVLFEQLKLGMTRPVSGKGTRAQAEYRFNNGVSAQALWDNEQTNGFGNLGLDLKLRWEVE